MTEHCEPAVWLWTEPDSRWASDVTSYVQDHVGNQELIVLHLSNKHAMTESQLFPEYILSMCRHFDLLESDRTTLFSYKDHLLAMELCISSLQSDKDESEPQIDKKKVLESHTLYSNDCSFTVQKDGISQDDKAVLLSYKDFLKHSNCADLWSLCNLMVRVSADAKDEWLKFREKYSFLVLGPLETAIMKNFLKELSGLNAVYEIIVESPLNSSLNNKSPLCVKSKCTTENVNIEKHLKAIDDIAIELIKPYDENCSATEEYAEDVMLAFLSLLVNCRNELALSKAMISPLIDLSHKAFTDVKHVSMEKKMPMCQTVISYVTRVRLGGKGYAPSSHCPLKQHLKGLCQFVDLLNQLQTVIEEDASVENAIRRTISILKNKLARCSSSKLRESSIEEAAKNLLKDALEIVQMSHPVSEGERSQMGFKVFTAINNLVNYRSFCSYSCSSDPESILEQENKNRTPLNLPPLLGYFRSPDEELSTNDDSQISSRFLESVKLEKSNDSSSALSYFHSSNSCSIQKSCIDEKTPSRVTFKGCLNDNNSSVRLNTCVPQAQIKCKEKPASNKPGAKRSILRDIGNETAPKKANIKAPKDKKNAKRAPKQKPLIKGQGQITKFLLRA